MFCPNCGEENRSDTHFCFKCGKSLSSLEHIHDSTIENVPNGTHEFEAIDAIWNRFYGFKKQEIKE